MMFGLRKPLRALLLMCSLVPIMSLAETANVAAASNMQFALQEIAARRPRQALDKVKDKSMTLPGFEEGGAL